MTKRIMLAGLFLLWGSMVRAEEATPLSALAKMPVREVTVFKDGHAFVLHSGKMPTNAAGEVQLDNLPTPVIGTFWPYSADKKVKLSAVTASQRRVRVDRTALSIPEMLEANSGVDIQYSDAKGVVHTGKVIGMPQRSATELEATTPGNDPQLPQKSNLILLQTTEGTSVVDISTVQNLTFRGNYKPRIGNEEFRNLLTLKLEWPNGKPEQTADVGMMYLQKGLRWIPHYRITLDGKGEARVQLQATLLNELTDLSGVTAHLVIGVPSFAFKETPDPISLQQTFASLSQYFRNDAQTGQAFSNAIMTQGARMGERGPAGPGGGGFAAPNLGPEVAGADRNEDLFLFTVKNITLKKGQRMVIPVAEFPLKYKDVYTLDVAIAPMPEMRANLNEQQLEMVRLLNAPKAIHKLRMTNRSAYPLTTAPVLIVQNERVLAQGMMTYTAVGATTDLELTTAVDIQVKKTDRETKRTPNAVQWQNRWYTRVDLAGTLSLTNYGKEPIELEITRYVLGNVGKSNENGKTEMVNVFEDGDYLPAGDGRSWWYGYSWPNWWRKFNGVGRITWKPKLEPGKSVSLEYDWNYIWE